MDNNHIFAMVPDDTGDLWMTKSKAMRKLMETQLSNQTNSFFKSFDGSLDGAMSLARKYYIKLKTAADAEAVRISKLPVELPEEDDPSESEIETDNDSRSAPETLKQEMMRVGDKVFFYDATRPTLERNYTDRVIKVFDNEDTTPYPIRLEGQRLLSRDKIVRRVYCGMTNTDLTIERGLHCYRELNTYTFVKGEVLSQEKARMLAMKKAMKEGRKYAAYLAEMDRKQKCKSEFENVGSPSGKRGALRGVCGLQNVGNTCFINAALQCVSQVMPQLHDKSIDLRQLGEVKKVDGFEGDVSVELSELVSMLWVSMYSKVTPKRFKDFVGKWNKNFKGARQHGELQQLQLGVLFGWSSRSDE